MYFNDLFCLVDDGDLIEWSNENFFGRNIRRFTKKKVSHSATIIIINDIPYVIDWEINKDCLKRPLYDLKEELIRLKHPNLYWLKLKDDYNSYRKRINLHLRKMENCKYNTMGILKMLLTHSRPFSSKKVFCSEAIQIALIKSKLLTIKYNGGYSLVPGEFEKTGLYEDPVKIKI